MREIIARDRPFTKQVWSRDEAKSFFEKKGEAFKIELVDAIPADQALKIYAQGDWLDLCRGPHMTSTGKIGDAFKLMKVAGAYWRGDSTRPMLSRIYATAFASKRGPRRLSQADRGSRAARPSQARARDGPVPFPGGRAGRDLLASEGLDFVPDADRLYAPAPRRRLSGGQCAAGARQAPVGDFRPLGMVSREHVHGAPGRRRSRDRGRAHLCAEADELSRPCPDIQERLALLSRIAAAPRRIRHRSPLRAVGRAARRDARARLHAGRRAYFLHRRSARRRMPQDQRADPVGLSAISVSTRSS